MKNVPFFGLSTVFIGLPNGLSVPWVQDGRGQVLLGIPWDTRGIYLF